MSNEKTIAALKTNFLRQQIRILSQPLKLSEKAKEHAQLSGGDLRDIMLRGTLMENILCWCQILIVSQRTKYYGGTTTRRMTE
jgi:hypothetical protein